jgi:phage tail-like protein
MPERYARAADAYKDFRIRVRWRGRSVAGFTGVAGLDSAVRTASGESEWEPITLERGVTHQGEFERWVDAVWNTCSGRRPPKDARTDLTIEVYDEAGRLARVYKLFRCWVSEYQSLPDLDANANAVEIQHLKLEQEGFERDDDVPDPAEPGCRDT